MARIRSIKPDFWTDEKIVELSPLARLLFIGMWNFVDDYGRAEFSPKRLKMQILPADSADISELLGELRREKLIQVYEVDNKEYFVVCKFPKHQKVDKRTPSRIPDPPNLPRIPPTEVEKDREKEKEKDIKDIVPYGDIIADLNSQGDRKFQATESTKKLIRARWKEGFALDSFREVHRKKAKDWPKSSKMGKFYRPETLYQADHFQSYLNEPEPAGNGMGAPPRHEPEMSEEEQRQAEEFMKEFREKNYGKGEQP